MADGPDQNGTPVDEERETHWIFRVALAAFFLNCALAVVKYLLARFSGSLAIGAGALDSATDCLASLLLYVGLRISTKKSRLFPLGLYKLENVISVVLALFIFFAGYEIALHVLDSASRPPEITPLVIGLMALSTLLTFVFGQYALSVGKKTGSPTMIAEGRHRQVDVVSSLIVLFSVLLSYLGLNFTIHGVSGDRLAAALVLVFIAKTGWELLADGMRVLLDASVDYPTLDRVRRIAEDEPLVAGIRGITGRNAGRFRFISAELVMNTRDLARAREAGRRIEERVHAEIPHVERLDLQFEPRPRDRALIAVPLTGDGRVSPHFGEAEQFLMARANLDRNVVEERSLSDNPFFDAPSARGIRVAEWMVKQKVDCVALREDISRKGPGYVFSNAGVTLYPADSSDPDAVVEKVAAEERKKLLSPDQAQCPNP